MQEEPEYSLIDYALDTLFPIQPSFGYIALMLMWFTGILVAKGFMMTFLSLCPAVGVLVTLDWLYTNLLPVWMAY